MEIIKKKTSWSKPNIEGLIGRKKVDWSIFEDGTTIPVEFHDDFDEANNGVSLSRGSKKEIKLIYEGTSYDAFIQNMNRSGISTNTYQIRYDTNVSFKGLLAEKFSSSLKHIRDERLSRAFSGKKVYAKVPDVWSEFIDFYTTTQPFVYELKFIDEDSKPRSVAYEQGAIAGREFASNQQFSAIYGNGVESQLDAEEDFKTSNELVQILSAISEQSVESQLDASEEDFKTWANSIAGEARIELREGLVKVRKYQQSIIKKLKTQYNGKCQLCGTFLDEKFGVDITEAHHIEYFSKTVNNRPTNIVIICPTHHRLLHAHEATFNRESKSFILKHGIELPLLINHHL